MITTHDGRWALLTVRGLYDEEKLKYVIDSSSLKLSRDRWNNNVINAEIGTSPVSIRQKNPPYDLTYTSSGGGEVWRELISILFCDDMNDAISWLKESDAK